MKKILYVLGIFLFAIGCKEVPKQTILNVTNYPTSNNIVYVYDAFDDTVPIDTIEVVDGSFKYTCDASEPRLLHLGHRIKKQYFITENGELTLSTDSGYIQGTPMNERISEFVKVYRETGKEQKNRNKAIMDSIRSQKIRATNEHYFEMREMDKQRSELLGAATKKCYEVDKGTLIGVAELMMVFMEIPEEDFIPMFEQGGDIVKKAKIMNKVYNTKKNKEKTCVGEKYQDFSGINPKDTTQVLKLSDFAKNDKYILLDFWASWCGPCREGMPDLKILNDKYASKGLQVLGVVISDRLKDHLKIAESLDLPWPQIFDSEDTIGELYGVEIVPTLILIDKDGTIYARTNDKSIIKEKVEELLGNTK